MTSCSAATAACTWQYAGLSCSSCLARASATVVRDMNARAAALQRERAARAESLERSMPR